ncbi:TonB-dependent receptor, partial [Fulvivirgaceae bacterium PWU5]
GYTGANDLTLDQYSGGDYNKKFLDSRYTMNPHADAEKFVRFFNTNRQDFELSVDDKLATEAAEAYTASEDVYAWYVMTRIQRDKLMLLGGVRYEYTDVSYTSFNVVNEAEILPQKGGRNYGFLLPQLHVKYKLNEDLNLCAAITRSYARPNFSDIVPAQEININEGEGTIGNTKLKPVSATNVDVLAEKYFGTVGILSGGVFYKKLGDFIFSRN